MSTKDKSGNGKDAENSSSDTDAMKAPVYTPSDTSIGAATPDAFTEGEAGSEMWFTCKMAEEYANQGGVPYLYLRADSSGKVIPVPQHSWYLATKNGKYTETAFLAESFLNNLNEDTYYYYIMCAGNKSDEETFDIAAAAFYIGPVGTDTHLVTSDKSLKFRANQEVWDVYVGGTKVNQMLEPGKDYYLLDSPDGTTEAEVVLTADFLGQRTPGYTYTLYVTNKAGDIASTTFKITGSATGTRTVGTSSTSPRTADESNIGLWAAFLLLSGAAVVICVPKLRKHKN